MRREQPACSPSPRRPQVWPGPQRSLIVTLHPPPISLGRNPECWGPGTITGAVNPAGEAQGSVLGPSFLKHPHPSGHRLELGRVHHLEREGEHGRARHRSPSTLRPGNLGTSSLPGPWAQGASTCVRVELQLSLGAGGWVVVALLLLFPLFHLQNSLQRVGEITETRW